MRKKSGRSIADIAAALHVSPSTVSRALRSSPSISSSMTEQVLAEARQQGYVCSKRKNLVIILPNSQMSNYDFCMLNALCHQCNVNGIGWEIVNYGNISIIQERLVHGIISLDYHDLRSSSLISRFNLPLVSVNDFPNIGVYSISSDAADGLCQALRHFKKLGHRKIIYLNSINRRNYCSSKRLEAYRIIGDELNLVCKSFPVELGAQYGDSLLAIVREQLNNGFTAAIVEGETLGIHISSRLQREGIKIPDDLSLITWDIPEVSEYLSPPVTAIRQNFPALAAAAVNAVKTLWQGESLPFSTKIPYLFFERGSTARLKPKE